MAWLTFNLMKRKGLSILLIFALLKSQPFVEECDVKKSVSCTTGIHDVPFVFTVLLFD